MNAVKFEIKHLDIAPDELHYQLPIAGKIIRKIPGADRPDYYLAKLNKTIIWTRDNGSTEEISNIVVCSRYKGQQMSPNMDNLAIAIAYVTDNSLLDDAILAFKKIKYAAKGRVNAATSKFRKVFN